MLRRIKNIFEYLYRLLLHFKRKYYSSYLIRLRDMHHLHSLSPKMRSDEEKRIASLQVNPYNYITIFKPIEIQVLNKNYSLEDISLPFSTATTIYNEGRDILAFLESLEQQTILPTEVILVDGGSTDKTISYIETYMKKSKLPIQLYKAEKLNIPQGRNLAIQKATQDLIVLADAGTLLDSNYCKNIVGYFATHSDADLVGGVYYPMKPSSYARHFIPDWEQQDWHSVDWNYFLPSTRSMALKKSSIEKAGYYPEYLQTGDDTLFGITLRSRSTKWVFNKKAFVLWDCPSTKKQFEKVQRNYGKGDGKSGIGDVAFYDFRSCERKNLPISDPLSRMLYYKGFLEGRKERIQIEVAQRHIKGVIFVLGNYPISDKSEHKILFFVQNKIAQTYKIIYVHVYPTKEHTQEKKWLDLDISLLELYHINDLNLRELIDSYLAMKVDVQIQSFSKHFLFDPYQATTRFSHSSFYNLLHSFAKRILS